MTAETKYTPGPWHLAGEQGVQIRSKKDQIAKVWTMRGNEWKANARLIAAAPELLEALQAIKDRLDTSPTHVMYAFEVFDSFYQELINKAIAKVTGETQ